MKKLMFCMCVLGMLSSPVHADDAWTQLDKAALAAHELSYDGIYTYNNSNNAKSVQITHVNYGQGEYARVIVLDGRPKEALTQGTDTVIFNQKQEKVVIEKRRGQSSFPALLPHDLESVKQNYQALIGSSERVAGRDAQLITLQPKDQYRYGYKLWLDREFGLLLKMATTDSSGTTLDSIGFSQLVLMSGQKLDWFQPSNVVRGKPYEVEQRSVSNLQDNEMNCELAESLLGYHRISQLKQNINNRPFPATHMVYSDGLATVSVFVEPVSRGIHPRVGYSEMGTTSMLGAIAEGHQIMVVGEVPQVTVTQFVNAVKFKKK
jgi:sigma-E factor negative regulatory protein RseB